MPQSQNQLQGSVPSDNDLVSLIVLDVSRNQLEGTVPVFMHSEKLQVLLLGHNQFSGTIPALPPMNQLGMKRKTPGLWHSVALNVVCLLTTQARLG